MSEFGTYQFSDRSFDDLAIEGDKYLDRSTGVSSVFATSFHTALLYERWAEPPLQFAANVSYRLLKQSYVNVDVNFAAYSDYRLVKLAYAQADSAFLLDIRLKYVAGRAEGSSTFTAVMQYKVVQNRSAAISVLIEVNVDPALIKWATSNVNIVFDTRMSARLMWEFLPDPEQEIWTDPTAATEPQWRRLFP